MTKISNSTNIFQYINNLNKKPNSSSLSSLSESKGISYQARSDELAKKVARGEILTEEERIFMEKHDPEKLKKAEEANHQRKELSNQLKKAKNPSQAESIIASALSRVLLVQKSGDNVMSTLMLEGIKKESNEYYLRHPKNKSYEITDSIVKIEYNNKKSDKSHHIDTLI